MSRLNYYPTPVDLTINFGVLCTNMKGYLKKIISGGALVERIKPCTCIQSMLFSILGIGLQR